MMADNVSAGTADSRGRQRGRLSARLLAWFLLFSLVPLVVTNAVGYVRSRSIIEHQVERYVAAITEVQVQHVRDRIDHSFVLLQAITAGNDFLAAGAIRASGQDAGEMGTVASRPVLQQYLRDKLKDLPGFDAIYLTTPAGLVVASAGDSASTAIPRSSESGASFTATVVRRAGRAQPVFRFSVPVTGSHPHPVAYLGATVSMTGSNDFLQIPPHLAGRVESYIVDAQGRPLFVSHPHEVIDYLSPLATPLATMPSGAHAHYRDREGALVLGTVLDIPGRPWRFIAEVPSDEAFGALRQLGGLSILLELLFVVLLVTTAWLVASDIVAPLHRLVHAARLIGKGDLTVRVEGESRDELGELGHAFNDMAAAVAESTASVRELHQREIERASQLATVGELASGIAHEIKNPVVGVSNGLDLVRRRVGDDPKLNPIMEEMARQLRRIQETLQELLTFARPATPALAPVSANRVVERAIRLVQPTADRQGVRLATRFASTLPRILADEEMLYQAFVNLLMNALEATPKGGAVTVVTRGVPGELQVEIADTGRGISPADVENVFKPFFTTRHTGTGLGLPITREIVQRHGGRLTLETRLGEGTTVTIHLPMVAAENEAAPVSEEYAIP